jgi:hypothetical protein
MEFKKYQHLERLGTTEVQNIELGECYVFPKIDGTNSCVWMANGKIQAGSRNRHLTLESDNAGFYKWVLEQDNIAHYLTENPNHRLFGEWLVPHSLKTYRENAWRNFYVFDVCVDKHADEILHEGDHELKHLHYSAYQPLLEKHGINYIPPISIIRNGSYEQFVNQLMKNVFLIEDGKGYGEGVVLKNYDFKNKFNRQTWAKIVTSEFKEKHAKTMGASEINGKKLVEQEIAIKFVTTALVEKEHAKIESESGWSSKLIPRLLNTVYYSVVKEDAWEFIKEHKNPVIDFKRLQHFVFSETKTRKPELF